MQFRSFVKRSIKDRDVEYNLTEIHSLLEDEVMIKVAAVGLCGSDLHMYAGHSGYEWVQFPLVLGHEVTGIIEQVGSPSNQNWIGKRVVVNPYEACGECEYCQSGFINRCEFDNFSRDKVPSKALQYGFRKPGGLAEYMKLHQENVLFIEDSVTDEVAAISEGLAVSHTAIKKIEKFHRKKILIVGPGPIGLGVAAILAGHDNKNVDMLGTSHDMERLSVSKQIGVSNVFTNWNEIDNSLDKPYDAIIDCSGHYSIPENGIKCLKRGGEIVLVGISTSTFSLPMDQIVRGEISIVGSYGITLDSYQEVLHFATSDKFPFDQIISEVVPFHRIKEGFEKALNKTPGKVIVTF